MYDSTYRWRDYWCVWRRVARGLFGLFWVLPDRGVSVGPTARSGFAGGKMLQGLGAIQVTCNPPAQCCHFQASVGYLSQRTPSKPLCSLDQQTPPSLFPISLPPPPMPRYAKYTPVDEPTTSDYDESDMDDDEEEAGPSYSPDATIMLRNVSGHSSTSAGTSSSHGRSMPSSLGKGRACLKCRSRKMVRSGNSEALAGCWITYR